MHPLDGAYLRVERAGKHLADFERRQKRRSDAHAKNLTYTFNPQTQRASIIHKGGRPPQSAFAILTGEIVYNLRAALDYLVFELSAYDDPPGHERTQFPMDSDCKDFANRHKNWLKGLSGVHIAAIENLQPAFGCKWAEALRDISNPDKHRHLTDNTAVVDGLLQLVLGDATDWTDWPGKVFKAQGRRGGHVYDVYVYAEAPLEVTFRDRTPVSPTLQEIKRQVTATLDAFKPEFK